MAGGSLISQDEALSLEALEPGRPSKSQKKREMLELQDLGEQLVLLSDAALKRLSVPDTLFEAIRQVRSIREHEGRRRQMQFIGRVMRTLDDEQLTVIRSALGRIDGMHQAETDRLHLIERWRDRLIESDAVLDEWLSQYPQTDIQHLRHLIRSARREITKESPRKNFREIFRVLKECMTS